jgi:signal transduction histidine kinase
LDGKKPQEIPIETLPGAYVFDSHELSKWNIAESTLPPESVILFEEPSVWERNKWLWAIILGLSALAAYLLYSRKQLKQAKESQRKLSGRLINAQEQERSRLAREIHDDFSQRLAVMALQLENIAEEVPLSYKEVHRQLHEVEDSASELGSELHALSYQLHSSTLENLGLVSAITAMCREFTAKNGVKANFTSDKVRENVDPDVALCAFRIVQEALRNVRKHSNAKIASVQLLHEGDKLVVRIRDDGHGFDLSQSNNREGLGIRSMEERTLSIGGNFKIRSEFGRGTTIEARVPLKQAGSVAKGHLA